MSKTTVVKKPVTTFNKGDVYRCNKQDNKRCGKLCVIICSNNLNQVLVTYVKDGHRTWLKGEIFTSSHKRVRKGIKK